MPGSPQPPTRARILNVDFDNITVEELVGSLDEGMIMTVHSGMLMKLQKNRDFYEISKTVDFVTCDSQILYLAAKVLGTPLKERVSGSDFFPRFYMHHRANEDIRIFLLGGGPDVTPVARERINERVGREIVVDALSPPVGFDDNEATCQRIVQAINGSRATVLVVCLGAPKQERFIVRYRERMPDVRIFLPLGGTVDYEAGKIRRPSPWVTNVGMEWLYRVIREPRKRWRRYFIHDFPVLYLIAKQRLGLYKNPFEAS